jgi:hypothetical protein
MDPPEVFDLQEWKFADTGFNDLRREKLALRGGRRPF